MRAIRRLEIITAVVQDFDFLGPPPDLRSGQVLRFCLDVSIGHVGEHLVVGDMLPDRIQIVGSERRIFGWFSDKEIAVLWHDLLFYDGEKRDPEQPGGPRHGTDQALKRAIVAEVERRGLSEDRAHALWTEA